MSKFIFRETDATTTRSVSHLDAETAPPLECCGCPDDNRCRAYCVRYYRARGGYCEGFLDLRCVCLR
ncbi:MAG: hypothetical protein Q4G45_06480 [Actinomycetia bacterium]|nr:hypothetical protein [Actinomycetes bacterium]